MALLSNLYAVQCDECSAMSQAQISEATAKRIARHQGFVEHEVVNGPSEWYCADCEKELREIEQ